MARLAPLPIGAVPELKEVFEKMQASGHFVPNSQLILQAQARYREGHARAERSGVRSPRGS